MEVITKKYNVYKYDELSPAAKEEAMNAWISRRELYSWADENIASLQAFAKHFNIVIDSWSIGGGDYVDFTTDDDSANLKGITLWSYLKNNDYETVKRHEFVVHAIDNKDSHDTRKTTIYDCCPFTGYCMDDTLLDEIQDFLKKPYEITYHELMKKCIDKWMKAGGQEREYQLSPERFKEAESDSRYLENGEVFV